MTEQRAHLRAPVHAPPWPLFVPEGAEGFTLAEAMAPGQHIETLCPCGERAEFDARAWMDRGLGFQALQDFSGRLRCLAQGLDVRFQCQYCGMERTWARQDFLGRRLRKRLAWTLARSQASVFCPQRGCGGHRPIVRLMKGGYRDDHAETPEARRAHVVTMLLDAGVLPEEIGL